jgi:hypothetical protein
VNRFDAQIQHLVGLWTAARAPAHKPHKLNSQNKQKRTNDVLPKPDNLISYRQRGDVGERRFCAPAAVA